MYLAVRIVLESLMSGIWHNCLTESGGRLERWMASQEQPELQGALDNEKPTRDRQVPINWRAREPDVCLSLKGSMQED